MVGLATGVGVLIPNGGIQFRLMEATGYRASFSLFLFCSGVAVCYSALAKTSRVRIPAAVALNACWCTFGYVFVRAGEFVPILFVYAIFFTFTCLLTLDKWE